MSGLPLALIPAFAATLMTYNTITPYVVIGAEVAFFHLMALNLLYPAIVGARVHLNPLGRNDCLDVLGNDVGRNRPGVGDSDYGRSQGGIGQYSRSAALRTSVRRLGDRINRARKPCSELRANS